MPSTAISRWSCARAADSSVTAADAYNWQVQDEANAVAIGSAEEASAAVARMLAVTQATFERRAQLEHALESRIAIEQAKGVIAERYGLELEDAFAVIRRAARTNRVKIRDLVARIRPRQPMPPEIEAALRQRKGV